jgi:hypothetical protein
MSARNGDRSRFQINRKRRLRHRERIQKFAAGLRAPAAAATGDAKTKAARRS